MANVLQLRPYQRKARALADQYARMLLEFIRQGGKSTLLGLIALKRMAQHRGALVTYVSASLLMGREITHKEAMLFRALLARVTAERSANLDTVDLKSGHKIERDDDFAEVFESGRLETRLWHDRTTFSRTQVIAPNPATARSYSGFVIIDEIGFIKAFRELWDALIYIINSDPTFRVLMATTPPWDEAHFSHELIAPPPGFHVDVDDPQPEGRVYRSEAGLIVHRVDVWDAAAAGLKLYHPEEVGEDGKRVEITIEEDRALSLDRQSWDLNMGLKMSTTGTGAMTEADLKRAQAHEQSRECLALDVGEDLALSDLLALLRRIRGPIGIGLDLATTEKRTSNPTGLALVEAVDGLYIDRLLWRWKTADPQETERRLRMIAQALPLCDVACKGAWVDATNERFYATQLQRALGALLNIRLINSGEVRGWQGEEMRMKELLGSLVTRSVEDGRRVLPEGRWVRADWRLVRREKGLFVADVLPDGSHADTFDGSKLATGALVLGGMASAPVPVSPGGLRAVARRERAVA